MSTQRIRTGAVAGLIVALVAAPTAAHANPSPSSGPAAGNTSVTVEAPGLIEFTRVETGRNNGYALDGSGNAYAWGIGADGSLGNGTNTNRNTFGPVSMPEGVTFTQLSSRENHTVALSADGRAFGWGRNDLGQLGDGTTTTAGVPTPAPASMPEGVSFTQVSAGHNHSLALGSDGRAYAWGYNFQGRLGNGTTTSSMVPVPVTMPSGVTFTQVIAGNTFSLALGNNGITYGWGRNSDGQLGNGGYSNSLVPVPVSMPAGVSFIQVSIGSDYTVAIGNDGKTYTWGATANGQAGNGTTSGANQPRLVTLPSNVAFTQVSAGHVHVLAIGTDGRAYSWGHNSLGALGTGNTTDSAIPVPVAMPTGVSAVQVSANLNNSLAIGDDGKTYSWGLNDYGERGAGSTGDRSSVPGVIAQNIVITGIEFDGFDGTSLENNGDGTWSINTPAHAPGAVDVLVSWTRNGVLQDPIRYPSGFTYLAPATLPTVSDPDDQTVPVGDQAIFEVHTTGDPTPTVVWEVSSDGGGTWNPVTLTDGTLSNSAQTLTVDTTAEHNGYLYRAVAENEAGRATSGAALLTVTSSGGSETPPEGNEPVVRPPKNDPGANDPAVIVATASSQLPVTGSDQQLWLGLGVATLLMVAGTATTVAVTRRRFHLGRSTH